jgi:ADP-ribosylglycohydrolase
MFQHRPSAFDPRLNAIAEQLRAIEKQLGGISKSASDRAAATASSASTQFAEAAGPILNDVLDRFRRGQKLATDEAASFGNDALERIAAQAKSRPLFTLAFAVGIGVLIGMTARRS